MKSAPVAYFDGRVSTRREALLLLDGAQITIRASGVEHTYPLSSVSIPPGVGSVRRTLRLPDGGVCELHDPELLAELERACGGATGQRLLHRWEQSLPLAAGALLLTVLVVFLFLRYGLPPLAQRAALALPISTERTLGRESLATLDRVLMHPSTLGKERRHELTRLFRRVAGSGAESAGYRLEFRSSPKLGANALALPSGIVIITDDLVRLARQDNEIATIMAHELGHVRGRHILRHILQSSASGLILATLTGDLVSITSLAATLPTALVNASFSRDFEREADDAAIAWMKSSGVPLRCYADILGRLQAQLNVRGGGTNVSAPAVRNYLSSHPDTGERIRRILREAAKK